MCALFTPTTPRKSALREPAGADAEAGAAAAAAAGGDLRRPRTTFSDRVEVHHVDGAVTARTADAEASALMQGVVVGGRTASIRQSTMGVISAMKLEIDVAAVKEDLMEVVAELAFRDAQRGAELGNLASREITSKYRAGALPFVGPGAVQGAPAVSLLSIRPSAPFWDLTDERRAPASTTLVALRCIEKVLSAATGLRCRLCILQEVEGYSGEMLQPIGSAGTFLHTKDHAAHVATESAVDAERRSETLAADAQGAARGEMELTVVFTHTRHFMGAVKTSDGLERLREDRTRGGAGHIRRWVAETRARATGARYNAADWKISMGSNGSVCGTMPYETGTRNLDTFWLRRAPTEHRGGCLFWKVHCGSDVAEATSALSAVDCYTRAWEAGAATAIQGVGLYGGDLVMSMELPSEGKSMTGCLEREADLRRRGLDTLATLERSKTLIRLARAARTLARAHGLGVAHGRVCWGALRVHRVSGGDVFWSHVKTGARGWVPCGVGSGDECVRSQVRDVREFFYMVWPLLTGRAASLTVEDASLLVLAEELTRMESELSEHWRGARVHVVGAAEPDEDDEDEQPEQPETEEHEEGDDL